MSGNMGCVLQSFLQLADLQRHALPSEIVEQFNQARKSGTDDAIHGASRVFAHTIATQRDLQQRSDSTKYDVADKSVLVCALTWRYDD